MSKKSVERTFYRWTRDLHLYCGLFVSPFVIAFAVSVFFLNHAKVDTGAVTSVTTFRDVRIPEATETARGREAVDCARQIVDQVGMTGEMGRAGRRRRHILRIAAWPRSLIANVDPVASWKPGTAGCITTCGSGSSRSERSA